MFEIRKDLHCNLMDRSPFLADLICTRPANAASSFWRRPAIKLNQASVTASCWLFYRPRFPHPFSSLTCQLDQSIAVLDVNWCLPSTWERHTVVFLIGISFPSIIRLSIWPYYNLSVLDPGQVPEIKAVTRSIVLPSSQSGITHWLMAVDFPHMNT